MALYGGCVQNTSASHKPMHNSCHWMPSRGMYQLNTQPFLYLQFDTSGPSYKYTMCSMHCTLQYSVCTEYTVPLSLYVDPQSAIRVLNSGLSLRSAGVFGDMHKFFDELRTDLDEEKNRYNLHQRRDQWLMQAGEAAADAAASATAPARRQSSDAAAIVAGKP